MNTSIQILSRRAEGVNDVGLVFQEHHLLRQYSVLENVFVPTVAFRLVWGLGIGTVAALLTAGPHVLAEAEHVPWASIAATLAGVLVFGLAACSVAASRALRASLVPALKADR